jgi:hypothetical protein
MVEGCGKYTRNKKEKKAPKFLTRTSKLSEPDGTAVLVRTLKIQKNNNKQTNKQAKKGRVEERDLDDDDDDDEREEPGKKMEEEEEG